MREQEQRELQMELERIFRCIENHLAPNDQALVRWAFGLEVEETEEDYQEALFV